MQLFEKHLQQSCIPWRMLGWLAVLCLVVGVWFVIRPFRAFSHELSDYIYSGVLILYPLLIAFLCFKGSPKPRDITHPSLAWRRFSPILLGIGVIFSLLEGIFLAVPLALHHQIPHFTSGVFLIELSMYPFFACAVLFLPSRHISPLLRVRIFLDSLSILVAVITLGYYFVMAPLLAQSTGTLEEKIVASISPLPDLVLMFCLLAVALRTGEAALRPVIAMLFLAEICLFTHDMLHLHEVIYKTYNAFSLANLPWWPGMALIAGAAQTISCSLRKAAARTESASQQTEYADDRGIAYRARSWKTMLAPALVLLFGVALFILWLRGPKTGFAGDIVIVYVGGFILLMLMVLRQVLMLYEIGTLHGKLQQRNQALDLLNAQLAKQATTDPLTGLLNHRTLAERLDEMLENAQANGSMCAVIFMDIDHFKSINDHYGHAEGDEVLCRFGELVQSCLRADNCLGRWGGEEFVAILPDVDSLEALNLAERIRQVVDERVLTGEGELNVTCSLGVACYPHDATEHKLLMACADQAMYTAKRLGRNQVRSAHEPQVLAMGVAR